MESEDKPETFWPENTLFVLTHNDTVFCPRCRDTLSAWPPSSPEPSSAGKFASLSHCVVLALSASLPLLLPSIVIGVFMCPSVLVRSESSGPHGVSSSITPHLKKHLKWHVLLF